MGSQAARQVGLGLKARYPTTLQWDTLQMDGQVVTLLRDACVPV